MNLYDFDRTIYKHDCTFRFYLFFLRRHIIHIWHVFYMIPFAIGYALRFTSLTRLKEHFLLIFKFSKDLQTEVSKFWDREEKNIFQYYMDVKQKSDVICSASPRFMLEEIVSRINPTATLVASEVEMKTMHFPKGEINNKGKAKVQRLLNLGLDGFECGYSDSLSDIPMLKLCKQRYRVRANGTIIPFDEKYFI